MNALNENHVPDEDFPIDMSSDNPPRTNRREQLLYWLKLASVPVLGAAAIAIHKNKEEVKGKITELLMRDASIQRSIVSLLAQPEFSGEEFRSQILGDAELQTFFVDTDELVFRIPAAAEEERSKFLKDPSAIRNRKLHKNSLFFRPHAARDERKNQDNVAFGTDLKNFHVDADRKLSFPYTHATFDVTPRELALSTHNIGIYGGKLYAYTGERSGGRPIMIVNHGAYVARPHHSSLQRFSNVLTRDVPQNREKKIQRFTDLVTTEIVYDHDEADAGVETMKRAPEILMSRKADCSNKAILLASLLEQSGEDYLLVYMHRHIAVAVEQGAFPSEHGYSFTYEKKHWVLIETTTREFEIGKTRLEDSFKMGDMKYLQRPKEVNRIVDTRTGRELLFKE